MLETIEGYINAFVDFVWGTPLLIILLGGGAFFMLYSRFLPYRYFRHAINVLRGKYHDDDDPGDISHYQALSAALAATIGVGNISGVAVAITTGGPGAVFWMWMSAFVGMATKFFTCSLSVMYRGKDSMEELQGGPMYVIQEGMGKSWKPLAAFFCMAGMIGCFPLFQANQLTEVIRNVILVPNDLVPENAFYSNFATGVVIVMIVSLVIFGGIKRIGTVAGQLMPFMVGSYVLCSLYILLFNFSYIPTGFYIILEDAFTGNALLGGALGSLIIIGIKRAAFSNEAGIGTSPMMHGAAKTKEPIREGLVAMLEPFIDTIVVCTMTALIIVIGGVWQPKLGADTAIALQIDKQEVDGKLSLNIKAVEQDKTSVQEKLQVSQQGSDNISLKAVIQGENIVIEREGGDQLSESDVIVDINNNIGNISLNSSFTEQGTLVLTENREKGVTITAEAFNKAIPGIGQYVLLFCITVFALTTLFSYSYYGAKCFGFLFGAQYKGIYNFLYVGSIIFGAVASVDAAVGVIDGMYALMAIPTVLSTVWLAPKVMAASKDYFNRMKSE